MYALKSTLLALGTSALLAAAAHAQTSPSTRTTPPQPNPEAPPTGPGASSRTGAGTTAPNPSSSTPSSGSTAASSPSTMDSSSTARAASSGQMAEQQFLSRLAHDNESEIDMAKVAKDQASSPRIKKFADQLIRDHEQAGDLVKDYAKKKNIDLKESSAGMATKDRDKAELNKLKQLKGAEFDREFTRQMVSDHEKTIKEVTTARTQFKDPELTKVLDQLLPKLKQHLTTARALEKGGSKA